MADFRLDFIGNPFGSTGPHVHDLVVLFGLGDDTAVVLFLNGVNSLLAFSQDGFLLGGNQHVLEADGDA